uniref:Uncharacterized protein n=1 Tax=Timema cristinae TaxID=61476 RepID=A0A7R9DG70_TIMCR|nr:unnamed protein product [Timema cristinae]
MVTPLSCIPVIPQTPSNGNVPELEPILATPESVDSSRASPESGVLAADVFELEPSLGSENSPTIVYYLLNGTKYSDSPDFLSATMDQGRGFGAMGGGGFILLEHSLPPVVSHTILQTLKELKLI